MADFELKSSLLQNFVILIRMAMGFDLVSNMQHEFNREYEHQGFWNTGRTRNRH